MVTLREGVRKQYYGAKRPLAKSVHVHAEAIMCCAAAFPLLIGVRFFPQRYPPAALAIGRAYSAQFWKGRSAGQWFDVVAAMLIWPFGVMIAALIFTRRNGAVVAARSGRSIVAQFADQLRLAATTGLLPPWYYIFELYRPGRIGTARAYFTRGQTKRGVCRSFAKSRGSCSPLSDKEEFAKYCADRGVATIPVLFSAEDGALRGSVRSAQDLPPVDLFVKPNRSRGGRGAERWDHLGDGMYRHVEGETLSAAQFLDRLRQMSVRQCYIVQQRARNHPAIADLSNGALNTLRIISCLDEQDRPEVMGAVLRMALGRNVTVDNVHAGGLAAAVDLAKGTLAEATNLGLDARVGWIAAHPDTGAPIAGRPLPMWGDALALIEQAHQAFGDRVMIGWDLAILADGPRLVEGNGSPDVDLIQRPLGAPFGSGRFGELLAFHAQRASGPAARAAPGGEVREIGPAQRT